MKICQSGSKNIASLSNGESRDGEFLAPIFVTEQWFESPVYRTRHLLANGSTFVRWCRPTNIVQCSRTPNITGQCWRMLYNVWACSYFPTISANVWRERPISEQEVNHVKKFRAGYVMRFHSECRWDSCTILANVYRVDWVSQPVTYYVHHPAKLNHVGQRKSYRVVDGDWAVLDHGRDITLSSRHPLRTGLKLYGLIWWLCCILSGTNTKLFCIPNVNSGFDSSK